MKLLESFFLVASAQGSTDVKKIFNWDINVLQPNLEIRNKKK